MAFGGNDEPVFNLEDFEGVPIQLIMEMKRAFEVFDTDESGSISSEELGTVMKSLGHYPSDEELEDMMRMTDTNGDGVIDFGEFLTMMMKKFRGIDEEPPPDSKHNSEEPEADEDEVTEEELAKAFQVFDKDGNGFIDLDELAEVMEHQGEIMTMEELEQMMTDADTNGDGVISYDEFVAIWL